MQSNLRRFFLVLMIILAVGGITFVYFRAPEPYRQTLITTGIVIAGTLAILANLDATINVFNRLRGKQTDKRDLTPEELARARRDMLATVRQNWIDDVLKKSLHLQIAQEIKLLQPDVKISTNFVDYPWSASVRQGPDTAERLEKQVDIATIFAGEAEGQLLILGEPGSGKTFLLLSLLEKLLDKANDDPLARIPVVFNLSSWGERQLDLAAWLAEELRARYGLSEKLSHHWAKSDALLLLLDGLDEVADSKQVSCVNKINAYRTSRTPTVVCCRREEYERMGGKLNLKADVTLQPLDIEQADDYLAQFGPPLENARLVLRTEAATFSELVQYPFWLNVMARVYWGMDIGEIRAGTRQERRHKLLTGYVERAFQHKGITRFGEYNTIKWLSWMAHIMDKHSLPLIELENFQPSWISRKRYTSFKVLTRLFSGLFGSLIAGLTTFFPFSFWINIRVGFFASLALGLLSGFLCASSIDAISVKDSLTLDFSWPQLRSALLIGLLSGVLWFLVTGLFVFVFLLLIARSYFELSSILAAATSTGFLFGVTGSLLTFIFVWFRSLLRVEPINNRQKPNQGIWQLGKNLLLRMTVYWLAPGTLTGLFVGLVLSSVYGFFEFENTQRVLWTLGPYMGLLAGAYIGLMTIHEDLVTISAHISTRYWLAIDDYLPGVRLAKFMEDTSQRLLLQRVGGSYKFPHRILQEHFASLYKPATD